MNGQIFHPLTNALSYTKKNNGYKALNNVHIGTQEGEGTTDLLLVIGESVHIVETEVRGVKPYTTTE